MTDTRDHIQSPSHQDSLVPPQTFIERHGISPILYAYLSLACIFLLYQIVGGGLTLLLFGLKPTLENASGFRIATGLGQILFILIPTIVLAQGASRYPLAFLGLSIPRASHVLLSIIGMLSLQQLVQIVLAFQEKIPVPESLERLSSQFRTAIEEAYRILIASSGIPELLVVLVVVACIPSVVEELLFRGLIMKSLQVKITPMKSAVITGIIFGAYHLNPFAFIGLAIIGIYLGILTARTGSVVPAMIVHFVNNAVAVVAMHYSMGESAILTGDTKTMPVADMLLSALLLSVIFAVTIWMFFRATRRPQPEAVPITVPE